MSIIGAAPYVYELWIDQGGSGKTKLQESPSTPDAEYTFSDLFAESYIGGSYYIVIKTSNGHESGNPTLIKTCNERQTDAFDITSPDQMANTIQSVIPSCEGNDGEISLITTGGTLPYTYNWTSVPTGQAAIGNTNNPTGLIPGNYTVEIIDANNCPLALFGGPIVENIFIAASPIVTNPTPAVCEDSQGAGQASGLDLTAFETTINNDPGIVITWYNIYDGTTVSDEITAPANTSVTATDGQEFYALVDNGSCQTVATVTYTINPYPTDPTDLQFADVGCNGFTATWTASLDAVEYDIEVVEVTTGTVADIRTVATADPIIFNSLATYTEYRFTVLARNACGESSTIASSSFTTDGIPPVPTGLVANDIVCDGFRATWDAVANATDYTVEVYRDAALSQLETSQPVVAPATAAVSTSFSGLTFGATYYFHVRAENDCGDSNYSPATSVTLNNVPPDPTSVAIQNTTCTSLDATWDPVPNTTEYVVEFIDVDAGSTFAAPDRTETITDPLITSFNFTGLTAGTQYQFRVRAINVCGDGNNVASPIASTDETPTVPTGLSATNATCTGFEVSWTAATDADTYTLEVYDDVSLDPANLVNSQNVTATSATVSTLDNSTAYFFRVRAENTCGVSNFTPVETIATNNVPADPTDPVASAITCTSFQASWTAATDAEEYVVEVIDVTAGANYSAPTFTTTVTAPATSADFSGLIENNLYEFRVRATNLCGESSNVTPPPFDTGTPPVANDQPGLTVCETVAGSAQASGVNLRASDAAIDGGAGHTITWYQDYDGIILSNPVANPSSTTVNDGQVFYAEVNDGTCSSVATVSYVVNSKPTPYNINPTNVSVCATDNATITLENSENLVNYNLISGGIVVATLSGSNGNRLDFSLAPGDFTNGQTYTIEANNGTCQTTMFGTATINIDNITAYPVTAAATIIACEGEAIAVELNNSQTGVAYQLMRIDGGSRISTGPIVNGSTGNSITFNPTVDATYDGKQLVVVGRRGSCERDMTGQPTVSVTSLTVNANGPASIPENTSTSLSSSVSGGSGYSYVWKPSAQIASGGNTLNPTTTNLTATTVFTLVATDTNTGCQDSSTVEVQVTGGVLSIDAVTANPTTICAGGEVQLGATVSGGDGNYWYVWTSDNGTAINHPDSTSSLATANPAVNTTFILEVRDNGGAGAPVSSDVSITVNPLPSVHNVSPTPDVLVCNGANVTISLDGEEAGVTYILYKNSAPITTGATTSSTGTGLEFTLADANFSANDTLTVWAENNTTNCPVPMNGQAIIRLNTPQPFDVIAVDTDVCTGENAVIRLTGSESGVNYHVFMGANPTPIATFTGSPVTSGMEIPAADLADGEDLTVLADNTSCTVPMNGAATVSISTITVANAGTDETVCADTHALNSPNLLVSGETGTWSVVSGSGNFDDLSDPTTSVDGLGLGDNTFRWTISNGGTCPPTQSEVTITRREITAAVTGAAQTLCTDATTLSANAPATGETGVWTVLNGGGTFANANDPNTTVSNLTVGPNEFAWEISDGVCTPTVASIVITRNQLTADADAIATTIAEGTTASLTGLAADGTGPYDYRWEPAALLDDPTAQNPTTVALNNSTTFTLTVTDQGVGTTCQATDNVTITITGGLPSVIASADGSESTITICKGESVQLDARGSGGDGAYTYRWDNSAGNIQSPVVSPTVTTVYEVEITDGNGDIATDDIEVIVNPLPIEFTVTNPITVCSDTDAELELTGSENGVSYQLFRNGAEVTSLAPVAGTDLPMTISIPQTEVSAGDRWTVQAESTAGCSRMMSGFGDIQISDPAEYTITTDPVLTVCQGQSATITLGNADNGVAYVLMTGGNPVDTLAGNTGNSLDFVLPANTFADDEVYTIMANNGSCQIAMSGSVEIDLVGLDATFEYPNPTVCFDGSNPLPVAGYNTGGTFTASSPNLKFVSDLTGEIDLAASVANTTYTVSYELASGSCTDVAIFDITITNTTPDPTFDYSQDQYCIQAGTTPPVFAPGATVGAFSYTTSGTGTLALAADGTIDLASSTPGTYRVANFIAGSGGSCTSVTHEETVQIFASDVADISYNGGNAICQSESTDPKPVFAAGSTTTGTFTVTRANAADITIVSTTGLIDLSDTDPGSYDIQFETNGPCRDIMTVTVEIEAATDASFTYPASSFCKGTGSVAPNAIATSPGVFSASSPDLLVSSADGVIDVNNSIPGSYYVIYETTVLGVCNGRDSVAIAINDVTADAGADDLACRLRYDLAGNAPAAGATGEWLVATTPSGSETATFANRFSPTTSVSVSDSGRYEFEWRVTQGDCSVSDRVEVEFYYALRVVNINNSEPLSCSPDSTGAAVMIAWGGSGSFTFDWSSGTPTPPVDLNDKTAYPPEGGQAQELANVLVGTHTLTVTDNLSGCDTVVTFAMGVQTINDDLAVSGTTICAGTNGGEITVGITTMTNNRTYSVEYLDENDNPVGSAVVLDAATNPVTTGGFAAGVYNLKIEITASDDPDEEGCLTYRTVKIAEHPAPVISLNTVGQPSCSGTTDGSISIDVSGTVPDSYAWTSTNGDTYNTQNLTNIPTGDYTLVATYNGTCTETFGPVSVLPQNTSDGPTAITPLAPSVQCSSFDARWSDEGVGITYQLDVSEDASFTAPLFLTQGVAANTTTFAVGGLAPGTPYFYRVRSVATSGCISEKSNVISVTTETGDVPSGLYATGASCDKFTANWAPVPGATNYAVQVATDAAFTNVLAAYDSVAVGSNDNKLSIAGLTGGQTYHYRVTATTTCGTSAYSAAATVTTDGLSDTPTNLSATAGCTTAELSWQAVSGSVSRYEVYLDTDNDFTNGTISASPDATQVTATTTVSGLTDGSPYFFHVLAILNGCDTTRAVSDFTTRNEPTPPAASASDIKCDGFTLSWPAVPDADDYVVDVSKDAFATFTTNTITDLSLEVGSLTPGTPYQYRIKARGCVESAFTSGTVTTDDTPPGLASAPTAAAPSCVGFTVSWTAQPGIRYLVEASPVGDNFTSVIERSAEVDGDSYPFTTLAVETSYNYRVISVNDCGEGPPTNGLGTISTKVADECGCGHDQVAFTVTTSNATCPGNADGAFTILSRKKSGVTVTPDMGRFKYRYQSLNNPADTSAWEPGEPGSPPLPHFFSGVKAGDYEVLVWDTLGLPGCVDTVAFTTTIGLQNEIRVTAKAETCDSLGQVVINFPEACNTPDRYYWARVGSGEADGDDKRVTISGLSAGDYQVEIFDFLTGESYDTLSVFVPNNCSTGTDTTTVCNLNGITFIPETTLAACDTGEGSVTFTSVNNTAETFTFTVIEEGGVVFETKEGTSGITFDDLPSRRYTYEIYDALSQSCRGKFTVGTKSVSFTATVPQTIACDDVITSINVTVDTDATLAAGPYEVFLMDQTDTLAQTILPLGSTTTTFADVAVGGSYEVVIVAAAEDACVARRTVDATPPGTTALQFTYQLDSATCFEETGSGFVTMGDIVVAENTPFDAYVIDVTTNESIQSRKFPITPESYTFAGLPNGQYQILIEQQQNGCNATIQKKRSETFVVDGPSSRLTPSIRSYVEVTVNYPYGTIEIDSIGNLLNGQLLKEGAPYEVRIAADPSGGSTDWVEVVNENPIVRPYRYEYLDQPVGTYFVELRDRFGCVVLKQVEVGYTTELYIPNIFTPNSDGENDTFQILNLEDFGENAGVQLTITNRWGRQVYRAKNYTNAEAWDGGNLSDGVYFYHLILPNNTIHNGWIEIWRGRTP